MMFNTNIIQDKEIVEFIESLLVLNVKKMYVFCLGKPSILYNYIYKKDNREL